MTPRVGRPKISGEPTEPRPQQQSLTQKITTINLTSTKTKNAAGQQPQTYTHTNINLSKKVKQEKRQEKSSQQKT